MCSPSDALNPQSGERLEFGGGMSPRRKRSGRLPGRRLAALRCMVCLLGIIVGLSPCSDACVPFGLGLISALRSFLTVLLCLSDLFTDPGVAWIAPFPPRLFFRKGVVLPRVGVAHGLIGLAELVSGVSGAAPWRLVAGSSSLTAYQDPRT